MPVVRKFNEQLLAFCELATNLATTHDADAMLFLLERPADWARLREATGQHTVLLAGDTEETLAGAAEDDFENGQCDEGDPDRRVRDPVHGSPHSI